MTKARACLILMTQASLNNKKRDEARNNACQEIVAHVKTPKKITDYDYEANKRYIQRLAKEHVGISPKQIQILLNFRLFHNYISSEQVDKNQKKIFKILGYSNIDSCKRNCQNTYKMSFEDLCNISSGKHQEMLRYTIIIHFLLEYSDQRCTINTLKKINSGISVLDIKHLRNIGVQIIGCGRGGYKLADKKLFNAFTSSCHYSKHKSQNS